MISKGALFTSPVLDVESYKTILLYSSILEALIGGLIVRKLKTGKTLSGLIHSIIMLSIVIIIPSNI